MNATVRLALTMGDPAGIGPEIIVKTAYQLRRHMTEKRYAITVVGSAKALDQAFERLHLHKEGLQHLIHMIDVGPVSRPVTLGQVSAAGGNWAYKAVEQAARLYRDGQVDAIVAAPLCKETLHKACYLIESHTEILAHLTGSSQGVMMLAHGAMRVTHVTDHCALGIPQLRLAVCGLNPHAGQGEHLGRREAEVIAPVISEYMGQGHAVSGPWPADTVFIKLRAGQFDAVVAMYHDQGHIPVKLLGFSIHPDSGVWQTISGVHSTLGLPILFTSVEHGTAFDIAGTGRASPEGIMEAIDYAVKLVRGQQ